ncbi:MAG: hypothetical protein WC635_01700 [Bacteriovorax sp.]|jgi:hypothetical protein
MPNYNKEKQKTGQVGTSSQGQSGVGQGSKQGVAPGSTGSKNTQDSSSRERMQQGGKAGEKSSPLKK